MPDINPEVNGVQALYELYCAEFKDTYITQGEDGLEQNAFASGVIACLSMLDIEPDDVVSHLTGRSVLDDVDEILIEKSATQ